MSKISHIVKEISRKGTMRGTVLSVADPMLEGISAVTIPELMMDGDATLSEQVKEDFGEI